MIAYKALYSCILRPVHVYEEEEGISLTQILADIMHSGYIPEVLPCSN